jgi:hypothetical protein
MFRERIDKEVQKKMRIKGQRERKQKNQKKMVSWKPR